jgi:general secretion pathway protein H
VNIRKASRGFTLLELMVVCVIVALLVALVPPLYSGAVPGARLKAAARDLAVALRETRSLAIRSNREQVLYLNLEKPAYRIGNAAPRTLADGVRLSTESRPAQRTPVTELRVRFLPDGSSSGVLLRLSVDGRDCLLGMNWLLGSITLTEAPHDENRL